MGAINFLTQNTTLGLGQIGYIANRANDTGDVNEVMTFTVGGGKRAEINSRGVELKNHGLTIDNPSRAIDFLGGGFRARIFKDGGNFAISNDIAQSHFVELHDNGSWSQDSDRRLKRDIQPLADVLDKALAMKPVTYFLIDQDTIRDPDRQMGFVAQDMEELFPSLVYGDGEQMQPGLRRHERGGDRCHSGTSYADTRKGSRHGCITAAGTPTGF